MNIAELIEDYDWQCAFQYAKDPQPCIGYTGSIAGASIEDVEEIIAYSNGENESAEWVGAFRLKDGRFLLLCAGCDYTGWDCQSGGVSWVAEDIETLVRYGMGNSERERLSVSYEEINK